MNTAAKLIYASHSTLHHRHWLKAPEHIQFKLAVLDINVIMGQLCCTLCMSYIIQVTLRHDVFASVLCQDCLYARLDSTASG